MAKPFAYRRSVVDRPSVAVVAYCDCIDGVDDYIAHSRVRSIVAPISLAVLGCLVDAVLWFVAVSVVHSIVLVAMCVNVKVGHLSGPS